MYKTAVYALANDVITVHIKNSKYQKVILHSMTLPKCQCTAEQYNLLIIAVFMCNDAAN